MADSTYQDKVNQLFGGGNTLPKDALAQAQDEAAHGSISAGPPNAGASPEEYSRYAAESGLLALRQYIGRNAREDVPLDVRSGLPAEEVAAFGLRKDPQDKKAFLEKLYGAGNVRQADDGQFIVAKPDPTTGGQTDVTVVPVVQGIGSMAKGMLSGTRSAAKLAATAAAAYLSGGASIPAQVGAIAAADALTGAAVDVGTRAADSQPIRPANIAADAAITAGADVALPIAAKVIVPPLMRTGQAFLRAATAPLATDASQPLIVNAARDAKYLNDKFNVNYEQTIGEKTGSPFILRTEAFNENMPGGSALAANKKARNLEEMALQTKMAGPARAESAIGSDVVKGAEADLAAQKFKIDQMRGEAARNADEAIGRDLAQHSLADNPDITVHEKAQAVKDRVADVFEASKENASALHQQFWGSIPGGDADVVPISTVRNVIDELKVGISKASESMGGGASKVLKLPDVMAAENEVNQLAGEITQAEAQGEKTFSLRKAAQLRTIIGDQIGSPNLTTSDPSLGYLKKAYGAVSEAMKEGVAQLPEESQAIWNAAQEATKAHHATFEQSGIKNLLSNDLTGGGTFVEPRTMISQLSQGGGSFSTLTKLKDVLGENSGDYALLKRAIFDDALERAKIDGLPGTIDGGRLLRIVSDWHPEVRNELLGDAGQKVMNNANVIKQLQSANVDRNVLAAVLNQQNPTQAAEMLKRALDVADAADARFKTDVMTKLLGGDLTSGNANPSEIVHRIIFKSTPNEAEQMMGLVKANSPALADEIKNKAVQKIFEEAAVAPTPEMMAARNSGQLGSLIDAGKLDSILNNPKQAEVLEKVIGPERMGDMRAYLNMILPASNKDSLFGSAGSMAKTMLISGLERGRIMKFIDTVTHFAIISKIITSDAFEKAAMAATQNKIEPAVSAWLASKAGKISSASTIARGVAASPSFIQALVNAGMPDRPGDRDREQARHELFNGISEALSGNEGKAPAQAQPMTEPPL